MSSCDEPSVLLPLSSAILVLSLLAGCGADTGTGASQGTYCDAGDAKSCVVQTTEERVTGTQGLCLHLVFENRCDKTIYALTSIEHAPKPPSQQSWQTWTSTVAPGFDIDVAQCEATGRYRQVSSFEDGQLTIAEAQCPLPASR